MDSFPEFGETYYAIAHLLFPPLALALIGLTGFVFKLVHSHASLKADNRSLMADIEKLKLQLSESDVYSQAKIIELQSELRPYTERKLIASGLELHGPSNTYVEPSTGIHYCLTCFQATPPSKNPLSTTDRGFHCPICKTSFPDSSQPLADVYANRPSAPAMATRVRNW